MSSEPTPLIGTEIGSYRIEAVLGRGGMGVVYRAGDARLGRKVALKVLPPEYGDDPTFRTRFLRESRLAASIDHPNVIPIYEAGDADGQLYIAMRHVDGTDLAGLLRREGPLEPERALLLVAQLAAALDAAHRGGLVHRDVKPSNALVTGDHVYLSDFGLSREAAGDATASAPGTAVGTVKYMAPEVIRSGAADPRSDLYSLACVLFECLAGSPPFAGPSEAAVIYGHLEEPPPRVSDRRPGIPRELDAVLARALDKDPDRRYTAGSQLLAAARAALVGAAPRTVRPLRSRRTLVAAMGAALVAAAALAALVFDRNSRLDAASVRPNGVAVIDPERGSLTGQLALDGAPAAIAAADGAAWVTHADRDLVSRVDLGTRTIRQSIRVGHGPAGLAVAPSGVWVANREEGTVSVVSPQTNEVVQTVPIGRTVDGICTAEGSVWVASPLDFNVVRLDAGTGRRTGRVRLQSQPSRLTCGRGAVWATSESGGTVTEISAGTAAPVRTVQIGRGISGMALSGHALWLASSADGTLSRLDVRRGAVTATIALAPAGGRIEVAASGDSVWASSELTGTVARLDRRGKIAERLLVGNRPRTLAMVGDALLVGVADDGARHRGGTLRLDYVPELRASELDPALAYTPYGIQLVGLSGDGLVTFRRAAGVSGTTLEANLAEAVPVPSDGGRTYGFRLRRGIRYSTGEPVRAGDIRFGLERAVGHGKVASALFSAIRGARKCTPRRCDLSAGVATDDAAGTVVFRLSRPDPELLYKLALPFAHALPRSVGWRAPSTRPLPATGPYRMVAYEPPRSFRWERNPHFRPWTTARPDGFPDAITARAGSRPAEVKKRVLAGESDHFPDVNLLDPEDRDSLRRRVPAQLRSSISQTTFYFALNTRVPPFDDLDARRAVAFALDRHAAVAAAGGRAAARQTCQLLPPAIGGRPYCPFTSPRSAGAAGRPDLETARRLVRRSGTAGMRVEVRSSDELPPKLGELMADTLRRLGYRASLSVLPIEKHFGELSDSRRRVQVGLIGWTADYPAPSSFLSIFTCDSFLPRDSANLNHPQFCDRQFDRLVEEARRRQATDPVAADALWARAERRLVDAAPFVGVYHPIVTELVSARLGNYQFQDAFGMLAEQVWVR